MQILDYDPLIDQVLTSAELGNPFSAWLDILSIDGIVQPQYQLYWLGLHSVIGQPAGNYSSAEVTINVIDDVIYGNDFAE